MTASQPKSARTEREPRWHASLAVLAALILYVTLPRKLTFGPTWVAALLVLAVLIPLSVLAPRRSRETRRMRFWSIVLIAAVNFFNIASVVLLIASFFHPEKARTQSAAMLLRHGMQIWLTNVLVFGLWFWEFDGGGPAVRAKEKTPTEIGRADFLFPQMQEALTGGSTPPDIQSSWRPQFFDYLYVAFTNSTAFSPTDTMPLTRWAKFLMLVEALISLLTIAIVLSRSVSLIQ